MLLKELGVEPTADAIREWLLDVDGITAETVGTTVQGRDIILYELPFQATNPENKVLLISLVHGNEPMGLFALLETVRLLVKRPLYTRVLILPIVNVDAYTLNQELGSGCRRSNLRETCVDSARLVEPCPVIPPGGVDLNRNHPGDWQNTAVNVEETTTQPCIYYPYGPTPWSEPESRAIRDVVLQNNVTAAMSFHSRRNNASPPLIIHPYASTRPFDEMAQREKQRYREWSVRLNYDGFYITGTAEEAIHYTAGGTTIDWMHSVGVVAFVIEVRPPCGNRWCHDASVVFGGFLHRYGMTGCQLMDLVEGKNRHANLVSWAVGFFLLVVMMTAMGILCWRRPLCPRLLSGKEKSLDDSSIELTEMEQLVSRPTGSQHDNNSLVQRVV